MWKEHSKFYEILALILILSMQQIVLRKNDLHFSIKNIQIFALYFCAAGKKTWRFIIKEYVNLFVKKLCFICFQTSNVQSRFFGIHFNMN